MTAFSWTIWLEQNRRAFQEKELTYFRFFEAIVSLVVISHKISWGAHKLAWTLTNMKKKGKFGCDMV